MDASGRVSPSEPNGRTERVATPVLAATVDAKAPIGLIQVTGAELEEARTASPFSRVAASTDKADPPGQLSLRHALAARVSEFASQIPS